MKSVPFFDINQISLMPSKPSRTRRWMKKIGHTLVIFIVVLLLTLTSPLLGIAQNPTQLENKIDGFPVMLDGKTLFFIPQNKIDALIGCQYETQKRLS